MGALVDGIGKARKDERKGHREKGFTRRRGGRGEGLTLFVERPDAAMDVAGTLRVPSAIHGTRSAPTTWILRRIPATDGGVALFGRRPCRAMKASLPQRSEHVSEQFAAMSEVFRVALCGRAVSMPPSM